MQYQFLAVFPPIIAVVIAFFLRSNAIGLGFGLTSAGVLASDLEFVSGIKLTIRRILGTSEVGNLLSWEALVDSERLFVFMFLASLGVVIVMIKQSGDFSAIADYFKDKIKSKKAAQTLIPLFSLPMFVEEYLSVIVSSSVMPPLTDYFKIARLKVTYLITSVAKPLCPLVPISSWGAVLAMFLAESGVVTGSSGYIDSQAFYVYLWSVPYMFFSIMVILSAFFVVQTSMSFGVLGQHELIAEKQGNLFGGLPMKSEWQDENAQNRSRPNGHIINLLVPIISVCLGIFSGLLCTGGFWAFGGQLGFAESLKMAVPGRSILFGAVSGLVVSTSWLVLRGRLSLLDAIKCFPRGIWLMKTSIIVLTLAWTFSSMLGQDLKAGVWLAHKLLPVLRIEWLPFVFFVMSVMMSFSIGSSWGTIALMMPIAVPMLTTMMDVALPASLASVPHIYPLIGAILGGSLFGITMSPVSNLLRVNSENTQVDHTDYLATQVEYIGPVGVSSGVGFALSGFFVKFGYWVGVIIPFCIGLLLMASIFSLVQKLSPKPSLKTN